MVIRRGDVALSPVGTAFCPEPEFDYAQVRTPRRRRNAPPRLPFFFLVSCFLKKHDGFYQDRLGINLMEKPH